MKKDINAKDKAAKTIKLNHLYNKSNFLMLMVSGGSDSVALAYIINELVGNKRFAIMHLNHNLRASSSNDAHFVEEFSKHLDVPFFGYSEKVQEIADNENIESFGHKLRYKLANEACKK